MIASQFVRAHIAFFNRFNYDVIVYLAGPQIRFTTVLILVWGVFDNLKDVFRNNEESSFETNVFAVKLNYNELNEVRKWKKNY